MADWQKTQYSQPKSWSEMRAESFEKKYPEARSGGSLFFLGALCIIGLVLCWGYLFYAVLRFFGSFH